MELVGYCGIGEATADCRTIIGESCTLACDQPEQEKAIKIVETEASTRRFILSLSNEFVTQCTWQAKLKVLAHKLKESWRPSRGLRVESTNSLAQRASRNLTYTGLGN